MNDCGKVHLFSFLNVAPFCAVTVLASLCIHGVTQKQHVKHFDNTWNILATALWYCMSLLISILLEQNLSKNLTSTYDKLSCDSSTGGRGEKDTMTGGLRPGGFTEVMFRMHVLWRLVFLPRQISNNGMRSNDHVVTPESRYNVNSLCLSSPSSLQLFSIQNNTLTMLFSQAYSRSCGWC